VIARGLASLAVAVAAALAACTPMQAGNEAGSAETEAARTAAGAETIGPAELAVMQAADMVKIIDVRTPEEFAQGHLPCAVNMPLQRFAPSAVADAPGRETSRYCRSGRRSGIAAQMLAELRGESVRHLSGGILAWQQADFATTDAKSACC